MPTRNVVQDFVERHPVLAAVASMVLGAGVIYFTMGDSAGQFASFGRQQAVFTGSLITQNTKNCTSLATTSTGMIVCGSASGISQSAGDARFVNQSGDTMTGSLNILNGKNLQVANSITGAILSGATMHTDGVFSASGNIVAESGKTISGSIIQSTVRCPMTLEFSAASGSAVTSGSGTSYGSITIPPSGSGQILKSVSVKARTKGVTGVTLFKAYNHTKGKNQLLSSPVRLEPGKFTSTGAYTISAVNNVSGGDEIIAYVPTVASTAPTGVNFTLNFDCQ